MKQRTPTLPLLLLLTIIILLFFAPALQPNKMLAPLDILNSNWPPWQATNETAAIQNPLITDVIDYILPVKLFTSETIRSGELPLWNPYTLTGYPATYNTQAAPFYPLSILYYTLPFPTAVDSFIILQMILGALFMILYLTQLNLSPPAILTGTIIFLFNGLMIVWLEWQVIHSAIIWWPLQLYLIEKLIDHNNQHPNRTAAYLIIAFAIPWLGGHWNWTIYGSLLFFAYLAYRLYPYRKQKEKQRSFLTILFLAPMLTSIQLLPAFNFLRLGHRQPLTVTDVWTEGLLNRLIVLFIPNFFGNPIAWNWHGPSNFNETAVYLGILTLFLVGIPILYQNKEPISRFWIYTGLIGFLLSLGWPFYGLLYIFPIFNGLLPSRAAILFIFASSILAAKGVDTLYYAQKREKERLNRWLLLCPLFLSTLLLIFGLIYQPDWVYLTPFLIAALFFLISSIAWIYYQPKIKHPLFAYLAPLLILADLLFFAYRYNPISSTDHLYPKTTVSSFLTDDLELFRIATLPKGVAFPPNSNMPLRITAVGGYEPAIPQRLVNYLSLAEGNNPVYFNRKLMPLNGLDSPLLDNLNVKYIVTIDDWWQDRSELDLNHSDLVQPTRLIPNQPLAQPFVMSDAGFHRFSIYLEPKTDAPSSSLIQMRILSADGQFEFANGSRPLSEIQTAGWYNFDFSVFPSDWGRSFIASIELIGEGDLFLWQEKEKWSFQTYYLPRPELIFESGKSRIYLNPDYQPRIRFIPQALLSNNEEETLALLQQYENELDQLLILELDDQPPPNQLLLSLPITQTTLPPSFDAQTTHFSNVRYANNVVSLETETTEPSFLLLADQYDPNWHATIDGEKTSLYRANSIQRAIFLPPGKHQIEFSFQPTDFYLGSFLSLLALVGCTILFLKNSK